MKVAELITIKQEDFDKLPTMNSEIAERFDKLHKELRGKLSAHYQSPVHIEQHNGKMFAMIGDGVIGECTYQWGYKNEDFFKNNISVVLSFMTPRPPIGNYKDTLN